MISCPLCPKVFKGTYDLKCHVASHTKEKPHKCHICSADFRTICSRKKHIKSVHDGIKEIRKKSSHCSQCSYKCYSVTMLRRHLRIHSAEQPFYCSVPGCGFKTKHESYLQPHVRLVHINERPYECPSDGCNYRAKSTGNLKSHLKAHSNEKPFKCQFPGCKYSCKFNYQLPAHTSAAHNDEKPYKCSTCDYRAKCISHLTRHLHTHEQAKRFQCQAPRCGFASHRKEKLKQHFERKHTKKDVLCTATGCSFKCGSTTLLKAHLKCHVKPMLSCHYDLCKFRARLKKTLLSHISRRHEDVPSERNEEGKPKHVCMLCFSKFTTLSGLEYHLKGHTREKPYKCSYCNYTAPVIQTLRVHARKIHQIHVLTWRKEDEVRNCRTCCTSFWNYSELVIHSMSHLQPVVVLEKLKLQIM